MIAKILDGKKLSNNIKQNLKSKIDQIKTNGQRLPGLAVILLGENSASKIYVKNKIKACNDIGIISKHFELNENTTQDELINLISNLNSDNEIDGILVQLPLPAHIDKEKVLITINPKKDVDGFHPINMGRLAQKNPLFHCCTPLGVINLLNHHNISLPGLDAVIVGASNIVGRPMALELLNEGATVTVCHSRTKNLSDKIKQADLLIIGIGNPNFVKADWIKKGAIVIDIGINRLANGSLTGDVDFENAKEVASWITPVPGGVGPMTVASLLENTYLAYLNSIKD